MLHNKGRQAATWYRAQERCGSDGIKCRMHSVWNDDLNFVLLAGQPWLCSWHTKILSQRLRSALSTLIMNADGLKLNAES